MLLKVERGVDLFKEIFYNLKKEGIILNYENLCILEREREREFFLFNIKKKSGMVFFKRYDLN